MQIYVDTNNVLTLYTNEFIKNSNLLFERHSKKLLY